MKLARYRRSDGREGVGQVLGEGVVPLSLGGPYQTLTDILEADDPAGIAQFLLSGEAAFPLTDVKLLAPVDRQEVWAAGVTYLRSKAARMEESDAAASCYDRVYDAPRPELFLKATPHRVVGPGDPIRIRRDSRWTVPEPELTLVLSSRLRLVGYTVGNDVSSRDIEGENPLYLPQAKVYDGSCSIGPWITLETAIRDPQAMAVKLRVRRGGQAVFSAATTLGQMKRSFEELIDYLGRDNSFPYGVLLMTGTGIVPESDFSLAPGDFVDIGIAGIGILTNPVIRGDEGRK